MYRAIVLTTLVLLLSAVAGVSVAQEGRIFSGEPNGDGPSESTAPEPTSLEITGPEDATTNRPPGASSDTEDRRDVPEPTVIDETAAEEPDESTAAPTDERTPTPGNDAGMPDERGSKVGKLEHASMAPGLDNPRARAVPHHVGKPAARENRAPDPGAGRQKVVLCHKGKTLTVGAPAQAAHLRHGDGLGACR